MFRFTVNVSGCDVIKRMITEFKCTNVTCLVNKDIFYFCYRDVDCYFHKAFVVDGAKGLEDYKIFVIPATKLKNLIVDGLMQITCDDVFVTLKFSGYSFRCRYNIDLVDRYVEHIDLIKKAKEYPKINLLGTQDIARLARVLNEPVICQDNTCGFITPGMFVYKRLNGPDFCVDGKTLRLLASVCDSAYSVGQYLVHSANGFAVTISKLKCFEDISSVADFKQKSFFRVEFNMLSVLKIIKVLKLSDGILCLDFNDKQAKFKEELYEYNAPIEVLEVKLAKRIKESMDREKEELESKARETYKLNIADRLKLASVGKSVSLSQIDKGLDLPEIILPTSVCRILGALPLMKTVLTVRKNSLLLSSGDMNIVFKNFKKGEDELYEQ